jgi:phospholipid/cholesterol/gamma-HCH transport system substrate-binding protein
MNATGTAKRLSRRLSRRLLSTAVLGTVSAVALSGCSFGGWVYNADLPGGAKLGSDPLTLTADFADVLDLVPQSSVKVEDVSVGRVTKIALRPDGHSARVTLKVNRDADLVTGTTARLEQSSLLGEKFVALVPPGENAEGTADAAAATPAVSVRAGQPLPDGAHLALSSTSAAVDVEQVLGALSLVLNGGGIGQFKEISEELQKISSGRGGQIRDFLTQMNRFVSTLDARKDAITSALDGLDHLSTALQGDDDKIANALDGLSPGMKVLAEQRPQLVAMLQSLDKLSNVTVATLDKSQKDMVKDLKTLDPILTQLGKAGKDLPDALQILLTYPFPDSVLGAIKGDYLNVFMTTNFRTVPSDCSGIGCAWPQVAGRVAAPAGSGASTFLAPQAAGTASGAASGTASGSASASASGTPSRSASANGSASASASDSTAATGSASASAPPPTFLPPTDSPLAGAADTAVPSKSILPSASGSSAEGSDR